MKGTRIVAVIYALLLGACARHEAHAPVPSSFEEIPKLSGEVSFTLDDGEESHRSAPLTFQIPDRSERENVKAGDIVKLMFRFQGQNGSQVERMWVIVRERIEFGYRGELDNDPYCTDQIRAGVEVQFGPQHIIDIWTDKENAAEHELDIDRIISAAREREAQSEEEVINPPQRKGEPSHSPAT
jgi:uncharacterized protein YegJ (DUF2314 family)